MRYPLRLILLASVALVLLGCNVTPPALPLPAGNTPLPAGTLAYDAPVSLTIKTGATLPGTALAYNGKTDTGQARVMIAGQLAPKQTADSVDWQGSPAPNVNVKLATRVATFDDKAVTLVGTARIEITSVSLQAGGTPAPAQLEFSAPVSYNLKPKDFVPGTTLAYIGSTANGAQFSGVEGIPYRKELDSLQYVGRLSGKVFVRFDLRVVSFSESGAVLGGTAKITIEQ